MLTVAHFTLYTTVPVTAILHYTFKGQPHQNKSLKVINAVRMHWDWNTLQWAWFLVGFPLFNTQVRFSHTLTDDIVLLTAGYQSTLLFFSLMFWFCVIYHMCTLNHPQFSQLGKIEIIAQRIAAESVHFTHTGKYLDLLNRLWVF